MEWFQMLGISGIESIQGMLRPLLLSQMLGKERRPPCKNRQRQRQESLHTTIAPQNLLQFSNLSVAVAAGICSQEAFAQKGTG